ncbi:MAG: uroporphyrinogen-III synthase [Gallionellaceae bacterium]|nr:MAG: uroporphyrinogen-III synthase [Gallionellaceae bacterium]
MADTPLARLNIVVTRPRDQAVGLTQSITKLGGNVILFPLLEIAPAVDASELNTLKQHLSAYDLLVFISPNAVKYGMNALGTVPNDMHVATIGQSSAQALHDLGVAQVIAPTERFDSEALLALSALQSVAGWKVAILRGNGGRELLGDTLKARGALVDYVTCYERSKPELDTDSLLKASPHALNVTSSEALGNLWQGLPEAHKPRFANLPLFVPHARIADLARQQGWKNIILTEAGDDGLLAALVAWGKQPKP